MMNDSENKLREYISYDGESQDDDSSEADDRGGTLQTTSEFSTGALDDDATPGDASESAPLPDDPVRMYLKEIGQVPLLDSNREMWLSTQIAAERHLEQLRDDLMSLDKRSSDNGHPDFLDVERFAYRRLRQDWDLLQAAAGDHDVEAPDFFQVLAEVQETILNWDRDADSYIRGYLKQRNWGKDETGPSWRSNSLKSSMRSSCSPLNIRSKCSAISGASTGCRPWKNSIAGSKIRWIP